VEAQAPRLPRWQAGIDPAQATSHKDCDLGKWIYSDGLSGFGGVPEMKSLEREHESLHRLIKTIMDLRAAGKTEEAEAEFVKVEPISKNIIDLLTAIEAKATKMAA
jgi:methyl-accepting chemotaxis protein